ncbi:uncharacterized protein ACOB8E_005963 [Sarcophilus harrisii]
MEEIERNTLIIGSPGCLDGSRTGQDRLSLAVYWQQRAARAPLGHPLLQGARLPRLPRALSDSGGEGEGEGGPRQFRFSSRSGAEADRLRSERLRKGSRRSPPCGLVGSPSSLSLGTADLLHFGGHGAPQAASSSHRRVRLYGDSAATSLRGSTEFSVAERVSPSPRAPAAYFRSLAPCPPAVAIATTCRGGMGEFGVPEADKRQDSAGRASPSPWPWLPPRLAAAELCLPSLCRFPSQGFTSPREGEFSDLLSSPVKTVSHWWMGSNCQSMGTRQQQSQASLMLW